MAPLASRTGTPVPLGARLVLFVAQAFAADTAAFMREMGLEEDKDFYLVRRHTKGRA